MAVLSSMLDRPSTRAIHRTQDVASPAAAAFTRICEVEKWPVWLSFLKSVRRIDEHQPLELGSEIALRGAIPGEDEELYEVDRFLPGYIVSLVGAYSVRRRIEFRIERKSASSRMVVRLDYPAYGGMLGALIDRITARRRLVGALDESMQHFKGLVEFKDVPKDELLADF